MILITGAGGFIGSHVCRLLFEQDHDLVATDQHFVTSQSYDQLAGDIANADFLDNVMQLGAFDTIIHLAGVLNTASQRQPEDAQRINIAASLHLLRLAAQRKIRRFIFGSSISVYGAKSFSEYGDVSEEHPASPNTVYGVSKRYVELVGQDYHQQGAFQFVALRIAMVCGAGATNTSTPWRSQMFEQLATEEPANIRLPFARTERLPLMHVEDVAEMIHRVVLAEGATHSIYNSPAEKWRAGELGEYIQFLNRNIGVVYQPAQRRGDPEAINGQRFEDEFHYRMIPLRQRLQSEYFAKRKIWDG